jgi:hypothetical protein
LPEGIVAVGGELARRGKLCHRSALPACRVVLDVIEDTRFKHKERPVDPAVAIGRHFAETTHALGIKIEKTEARRRTQRRYGRKLAMGPVKREKSIEVNIC